jgi:hypothetical protein
LIITSGATPLASQCHSALKWTHAICGNQLAGNSDSERGYGGGANGQRAIDKQDQTVGL